MIVNFSFTALKTKLLFHFQSMKVPKARTRGMSARIPDTTLFVTFLDYDNIKDWRLDEELLFLQDYFELGDFHVFKTNEFGRHVIGLDVLKPIEVLEVIDCSTCDWLFKHGIKMNEYRTWILRGWEKGDREKPTYLRTVESPYNGKRPQSQAHAIFLEAYYDVPVRLVKPDGNTLLEFNEYNTSSKVSVKDLLKEMKR